MLTQQNRLSERMADHSALPQIQSHLYLPKLLNPDETIGDYVSSRPYITVPLDCPVDTIMTIMSHSGRRVAAIIDGNGILNGFLTRTDLSGRIGVAPDATDNLANHAHMADHNDGLVRIWEEGLQEAKIKAGFTRADMEHDNAADLCAADVMTRNPAFLPSELGLKDALTIMENHGYHYMPVLGDDAYLLGIADLTELSAAIAQRDHGFDDKANLSIHLMRPAIPGIPYGATRAASGYGGF